MSTSSVCTVSGLLGTLLGSVVLIGGQKSVLVGVRTAEVGPKRLPSQKWNKHFLSLYTILTYFNVIKDNNIK